MDEARVIALIFSGDTDAFAEIIENYQLSVIRYLYRLTGDYSLAQDLAQDTFIKAYKEILKTNSELSLRTWLYKIATNTALQNYRRKKILTFIPLGDRRVRSVANERETDERLDREILVQRALTCVADRYRACMVLHFIEGFKYREIGEILGISDEAVRKRVAKGSREFKEKYTLLSQEKKTCL